MKRDEAIAKLRALRPELEALGFRHVWLFGSVARDEAGPESDVDLLVEVDEARYRSTWNKATYGLEQEEAVGSLLGSPTDVVDQITVTPRFLERARRDGIRIF
jgi:predicted nucleotidyltransferase